MPPPIVSYNYRFWYTILLNIAAFLHYKVHKSNSLPLHTLFFDHGIPPSFQRRALLEWIGSNSYRKYPTPLSNIFISCSPKIFTATQSPILSACAILPRHLPSGEVMPSIDA